MNDAQWIYLRKLCEREGLSFDAVHTAIALLIVRRKVKPKDPKQLDFEKPGGD